MNKLVKINRDPSMIYMNNISLNGIEDTSIIPTPEEVKLKEEDWTRYK